MSGLDIPLVVPGVFPYELWVKPLDDGRDWEIVHHLFSYVSSVRGVIEVPVGFITDFASVPRVLWSAYPPWGAYGWAAVIHDYLYTVQMLDRSQSDFVLLEAMGSSKVGENTRGNIYEAVRTCGGHSWDEHTEILKGVKNEFKESPEDIIAVIASRRGRGLPDFDTGIQRGKDQPLDPILSTQT